MKKPLIVLGLVLVALAGLAAFALLAFFVVIASLGTVAVTVKVDATVVDRGGARVPGCLLALREGPNDGYGKSTTRTDASGRAQYETWYTYGAIGLWPFDRHRTTELRFYLGDPPRYGTMDEVEAWDVTLKFDEPWFADEVTPTVAVARSMAHEEILTREPGGRFGGRNAGATPLPAGPEPPARVPTLRFERETRGGESKQVYRVPLAVTLDPAQVGACTARRVD